MQNLEENEIKKEWEIIHSYLKKASLIVVALFIVLLIALFTFKINSAAVAQGQIVLSTNKKTIQHLEGGIVKEILVKNGDLVKKDQPLIILSDAQSKQNIRAAQYQLDSLKAEIERLNLQLQNKEFVLEEFSKKYPSEIAELEQKNFISKTKSYSDNLETIKSNIDQAKTKIKLLKREEEIAQEKFALMAKEKKAMDSLFKSKNITRSRYLDSVRQMQEANISLINTQSELKRETNSEKELQIKLENVKTEYESEINGRITQAMREMSEADKQYKNAIEIDQRLTIRSPVDGYVRNMQVFTIGGVFRNGQDLLDIIPIDEELLVEVKIDPKDRDIVKVNQDVMVNFSFLQSKIAPRLKGKLTYLDPDITKEQSGKSYYTGRILIAKEEKAKIKDLELHPGMPVEAYILVHKKSFATILFTPLLQQIARAFRDD